MRSISLISLLTVSFLITLHGCGSMKYSPWQSDVPSDKTNTTLKNLDKLQHRQQLVAFPMKIALLGDPQGHPGDLEKTVSAINRRSDIDFTFVIGDLTDYGLRHEYLWVYDIMKKLDNPYFTVIGNHDALANGKKIYQDMFGDLDYTFDYAGIRFLMWNNNKLEFSTRNFDWLRNQVNTDPDVPKIVVAHVPPQDDNYFSDEDVDEWVDMVTDNNVLASLHGHIGTTDYHYNVRNDIPFLVVAKNKGVRYSIMTIDKGEDTQVKVSFTHCHGDHCWE